MSGALLFWIIVLDCWSMSFQLTTCTSRVLPVFALYAEANWVQNFDVLSFEYSAATSLIVVVFLASPLSSSELAPVPPPQPARSTVMPQIPAESARERLFIEGLLWESLPIFTCSH